MVRTSISVADAQGIGTRSWQVWHRKEAYQRRQGSRSVWTRSFKPEQVSLAASNCGELLESSCRIPAMIGFIMVRTELNGLNDPLGAHDWGPLPLKTLAGLCVDLSMRSACKVLMVSKQAGPNQGQIHDLQVSLQSAIMHDDCKMCKSACCCMSLNHWIHSKQPYIQGCSVNLPQMGLFVACCSQSYVVSYVRAMLYKYP